MGDVEEEHADAGTAECGGDEGRDRLEELRGDAVTVSCSQFASRSSHVLGRSGTPGSAIERGRERLATGKGRRRRVVGRDGKLERDTRPSPG